MRLCVLYLVALSLLSGCTDSDVPVEEVTCNSDTEYYFSPDNRTFIAPANAEPLMEMCHRNETSDISSFYNLDFDLICTLQENFLKLHSLFDQLECFEESYQIDFSTLHYQLIGVQKDVTRYIYINAFDLTFFPDALEFWNSEVIDTCGFDVELWGVYFNLNTLEFENLEMNPRVEDPVILKVSAENILSNLCTRCPPNNIGLYFDPTPEQVCYARQDFNDLFKLDSNGCNYRGRSIDKNIGYVYQFMGVEIADQPSIYVNGLWIPDGDIENLSPFYTSRFIGSCDGGFVYWGAVYNIEDRIWHSLEFNSPR